VVTGVTGSGLQYPEVPAAAKAAATAINDAGGVKDPAAGPNRPIEIVFCDDGGLPAQAAACGRQLVDQKVIAVAGSASGVGDAYEPITIGAGIPLVGIQASTSTDLTSPLSFPMSGGTVALFLSTIKFLSQNGVKAVSIEHVQLAVTDSAVAAIKSKAKELGIQVVNDVPVPTTAVDFAPFASQMTANGANGAIFIDSPARDAKFVTALTRSGVSFKNFPTIGVITQDQVDLLGKGAADGYYTPQFTWPLADKGNKGIERFLSEYATVKGAPAPSHLAVQAWTAVHVLAENVFPKMQTLDAATLVKTLSTIGPISRPEYVPFDWRTPVQLLPGQSLRTFSDEVVISRITHSQLQPVTAGFTSYL
jgi:ABC-type branched-subunit amino acid transport system substrate-binding protein